MTESAVSGRAILVIDDDEAVREVVRRTLEIAGHRVTCASSGLEALEKLSDGEPIDLVIMDLVMPGEDALTTFQRLRQGQPSVPVLLCTGLPDSDVALALLNQPRVALIRKPFRMHELWDAVKQAIGGNLSQLD